MEKVTFINSMGESIEFSSDSTYRLNVISGIGELPLIIQSNTIYGTDGNVYYDTYADVRTIKLDFQIFADTSSELISYKRTAQRILNPKLGQGTLIYENDNDKYRIDAAIFYCPTILTSNTDRTFTYQHIDVGFVCNQPFWESFIEYQQVIVGIEGGLEFPLEFPISFATTADNVALNNIGDVSTSIRVEFRGPATGCKIEKLETGEFIEVDYELLENEKLIIDTNQISPSVYFVNTSGTYIKAFNKINVLSNCDMQFTQGINTFKFTALTGTPACYIYYRYKYVGV